MRPNNRNVKILAVFMGLILFVGWSLNTIPFTPAPSYNPVYSSGFLERLDAEGHAIEKHVGKDNAFLLNRLATEDISAASTFTNMEEAEDAIHIVLSERQDLVQNWLGSGKSDVKAFYYHSSKPVGRVMNRGRKNAIAGNQVRVVLRRDDDYPEGFHLITAYPEVK